MMKNKCFMLLSIPLLLLLPVISYSFSPHASGRSIMWGSGGFQYILYENRQFFKLDADGITIQSSGTLFDKKSVKDVFSRLDAIKFDKCFSNNQNGEYFVIKVISTEGEHQVAWTQPEELGKKYNYRVPGLYSELMTFVRN